MEKKYDSNTGEKKQLPNKIFENNYNSSNNSNLSIPLKQRINNTNNPDFHLENHNFQIIQKKVDLIGINKKEELSKALNKNDNIDNKIVNTNELNEKVREYFKRII